MSLLPKLTLSPSGADAFDWTDPCQRAIALATAYYEVLRGLREVEIRTRSLDAEDLVRFQPADMQTLWVEMTAAQSECAKASGKRDPNRRFAIAAGSRSDIPYYNRNFRRPI